MKTYTVDQIRKYLESVNSFGDALYYCKEEYIDEANNQPEEDFSLSEDEE